MTGVLCVQSPPHSSSLWGQTREGPGTRHSDPALHPWGSLWSLGGDPRSSPASHAPTVRPPDPATQGSARRGRESLEAWLPRPWMAAASPGSVQFMRGGAGAGPRLGRRGRGGAGRAFDAAATPQTHPQTVDLGRCPEELWWPGATAAPRLAEEPGRRGGPGCLWISQDRVWAWHWGRLCDQAHAP